MYIKGFACDHTRSYLIPLIIPVYLGLHVLPKPTDPKPWTSKCWGCKWFKSPELTHITCMFRGYEWPKSPDLTQGTSISKGPYAILTT
jgi:hypothetical protein